MVMAETEQQRLAAGAVPETMEYTVRARAEKGKTGVAECKEATLAMDTSPEGQPDAFNPAERLLASVAPCMIKNIERVAPC